MRTRIVIHAGLPKTGTTAIQGLLRAGRRTLADRGILYPDVDGTPNHNLLAVPFREHLARMYRHDHAARPDVLASEARRAWEAVGEEFADQGHEMLVLSAEHFAAATRVGDLRALLDRLFPAPRRVEIVFYLRRPSRRHASALQQHLKADHELLRPFSDDPTDPDLVIGHELAQVTTWSQVGELVLREFAPDGFADFDVTRDFLQTVGIDGLAEIGRRANASLSAEAMQLLQDHRREEYGHKRGVFDPGSDQFERRLAIADRGTRRPATRPRLHDTVADAIDHGSPDVIELRDRFGFTYTGIDYERIGHLPDPLPGRATEVRDVMPLDEQRVVELAGLMTLDGALERLAHARAEAADERARVEAVVRERDAERLRASDLEARVEQVRASTSWRMTRPVRLLGDALRRRRGSA